MGKSVLTSEEFPTLLAQIEKCLNSKPFCPISSDLNDLTALTSIPSFIGSLLTIIAENDIQRWKLMEKGCKKKVEKEEGLKKVMCVNVSVLSTGSDEESRRTINNLRNRPTCHFEFQESGDVSSPQRKKKGVKINGNSTDGFKFVYHVESREPSLGAVGEIFFSPRLKLKCQLIWEFYMQLSKRRFELICYWQISESNDLFVTGD
ncbi:hypothetical protein TNIN_77761 [Trichonephila inaurata madagascariensis]|uniref:Uncharacterized protein n=1 Tax=Trichonephila inaurata madagascariensis TaxID=2747483 RepID=A0A8X7BQ20_9ARAC|nr:hypothetical protein TNIN_77761 [Trichonephila inaurata madagascariensis]